MKRGRAMSRQESNLATWLNEAGDSEQEGELIFARLFPEQIESEAMDVGSVLHSNKPAENTAQFLSIFRRFVGFILEAQLDEVSYDVYLMAYDAGVTEGLSGVNSAASNGVRKGLKDAMHVSRSEVSRRIVGKSSELGRRHGMLIRQLIQGDFE